MIILSQKLNFTAYVFPTPQIQEKKYHSNNIIIGELLPAQQLILPSTAWYWVCKENLLLMWVVNKTSPFFLQSRINCINFQLSKIISPNWILPNELFYT